MWHSNVYVGTSQNNAYPYCVQHMSSAYTEAYSCFFSSGWHSFNVTTGKVSIYNCIVVGGIDTSGACLVKHVNSLHDGPFNAKGGAQIWVTGMKWTEESTNVDVWFTLTGTGSQIIVSNSKAATNTISPVVNVGNQTVFKAFNSEFTNNATNGDTITGPSTVTVYLYYCVLSKDVSGVQTGDSIYIKNVSSE